MVNEEIYMGQPPDYEDGTALVCQLHKALYGLKQAGRVWNELLNQTFTELGYTRSKADPCLYYWYSDSEKTIVGVHVDDMAIASNSNQIGQIKQEIASKFEVTDLGELTKMLGFEIKHDKKSEYS